MSIDWLSCPESLERMLYNQYFVKHIKYFDIHHFTRGMENGGMKEGLGQNGEAVRQTMSKSMGCIYSSVYCHYMCSLSRHYVKWKSRTYLLLRDADISILVERR